MGREKENVCKNPILQVIDKYGRDSAEYQYKGYYYGLNEQAIISIACKRPLLENALVLGKPGRGMVFSAKIDTLNEYLSGNSISENIETLESGKYMPDQPKVKIPPKEETRSKRVNEQSANQDLMRQMYMKEKELRTLKLLTVSAIAYAEWHDIITKKMRDNKEIGKLFMELPTVQGLSNIMTLERLKDSDIDVNSITSLEDVMQAMQIN